MHQSMVFGRTTTAIAQLSRGALATKKPVPDLVDKVLIANRGEIALRVIRTAKKLGIRTVSIFSDVDRHAMHVRMADESFSIGSSNAYLDASKIIELALKAKCKAIHPGYGFLSENADFAKMVAKAGLIFIGPSSDAIRDMGSKSASKQIMEAAGVSCVPGYHGEDQSEDRLLKEAKSIGFPIMIKAVSGGGGKGMRIVHQEEQFIEALNSSRRESMKSFSDDRVLVEKYLSNPRHIEVQIFADSFGNAIYLFERDCSIQRRHQKIIEEAPAPNIGAGLRSQLGEMAVSAAKAVGYVGAGTVEFIVDADHPEIFYFMEMNTRLQVEHPITEMITGLDLVQLQLEVASGRPLSILQKDVQIKGHAFEARIYAENPVNNFFPETGKVEFFLQPPASPDLRLESGIKLGDEISIHYDPMIAKLVVHGPDRSVALRRFYAALCDFKVAGIVNNVDFLKKVIAIPEFVKGHVGTWFIEKHKGTLFSVEHETIHNSISAFLSMVGSRRNLFRKGLPVVQFKISVYNLGHDLSFLISLERMEMNGKTIVRCKEFEKSVEILYEGHDGENASIAIVDGEKVAINIAKLKREGHYTIFKDGSISISVSIEQIHGSGIVNNREEGSPASSTNSVAIKSPMYGRVLNVLTSDGALVKVNQTLVILEAMKMEHSIKSPIEGRLKVMENVKKYLASGQIIPDGTHLFDILPQGKCE